MTRKQSPLVLTERGEAVADFAALLCIVVSIICFVAIAKMLGA